MTENDNNGPVASGILRTLKYFGLFRFPLLPGEIHRFHPYRCSRDEITASLDYLAGSGQVACSNEGFYSLKANEAWTAERKAGRQRALALLSRSAGVTKLISSFPFVDAIAISGSLSKYYAGEDADIDYFIVTDQNRLWIARTLLHLFKKLTFIPGYQNYFCMNYFVDAGALEMTDKNLYTAIELATLIPVYNTDRITSMKNLNTWFREYLPNEDSITDSAHMVPAGKERLKKLAEWLIGLFLPEKMNRFFMRLTDRKWHRKWSRKGFPMEEYDQAFYTTLHVSKNHPANFQKRVLCALENTSEIQEALL